MQLHVWLRPANNALAAALLAATVYAVQANAQQPTKAPANASQASSGQVPVAKPPAQVAPGQTAAAGGVVVFIDPETGKMRQPDAAEIGALTGASTKSARATIQSTAEPTPIQGPGSTLLVKLGDDSLNYMVVTKTPDGKLAENCVTGDQAAAALLSKGVMPKTTAAPKKNVGVLDDK